MSKVLKDRQTVVIGMSGAVGSGRGTFAHMLVDRIGGVVSPLRDIIDVSLPEDYEQALLARIRRVDPKLLIRAATRRHEGALIIVVPDIETRVEAAECDMVFHIERPEYEQLPGESLIGYSPLIVHNSGDVIDLEVKVDQIAELVGGGRLVY